MKEMLAATGSAELTEWRVFLRMDDERRLREQAAMFMGGFGGL